MRVMPRARSSGSMAFSFSMISSRVMPAPVVIH
jgi:hypothetical protein